MRGIHVISKFEIDDYVPGQFVDVRDLAKDGEAVPENDDPVWEHAEIRKIGGKLIGDYKPRKREAETDGYSYVKEEDKKADDL